ncbi:hypothetical protein AX15_003382 [Amanita polypyramis BW_CC]|nr:hypothetical protein AX15_003382 [Amanita polypyramis BW_CC]
MIPRHSLRGRVPSILFCPQRRPLLSGLLYLKTNTSPLPSCARPLSTSTENKSEASLPGSQANPTEPGVYRGPLAMTFYRLKIFSLGSLSLSITLAPFMFLVESSLPVSARLALASIAIGTSGLSTALVGWCGKPYVKTLKRLKTDGGAEGLEMITYNLTLQPRISRIYDPYFLIETKRPFARWELAQELPLPPDRSIKSVIPGKEETIAETLDINGHILGRWIVQWDENGRGKCHEAGSVIRYFNVHEELL